MHGTLRVKPSTLPFAKDKNSRHLIKSTKNSIKTKCKDYFS